jgi:hypothetical protein
MQTSNLWWVFHRSRSLQQWLCTLLTMCHRESNALPPIHSHPLDEPNHSVPCSLLRESIFLVLRYVYYWHQYFYFSLLRLYYILDLLLGLYAWHALLYISPIVSITIIHCRLDVLWAHIIENITTCPQVSRNVPGKHKTSAVDARRDSKNDTDIQRRWY